MVKHLNVDAAAACRYREQHPNHFLCFELSCIRIPGLKWQCTDKLEVICHPAPSAQREAVVIDAWGHKETHVHSLFICKTDLAKGS